MGMCAKLILHQQVSKQTSQIRFPSKNSFFFSSYSSPRQSSSSFIPPLLLSSRLASLWREQTEWGQPYYFSLSEKCGKRGIQWFSEQSERGVCVSKPHLWRQKPRDCVCVEGVAIDVVGFSYSLWESSAALVCVCWHPPELINASLWARREVLPRFWLRIDLSHYKSPACSLTCIKNSCHIITWCLS